MTAKTAPKSPYGIFQQLGKTFMLPVALLSFCGSCWDRQLAKQSRCFDSAAVAGYAAAAGHLYLDEQGRLLAFSFLPVMFVSPSRWVWRERTKASPPSPASLATRS